MSKVHSNVDVINQDAQVASVTQDNEAVITQMNDIKPTEKAEKSYFQKHKIKFAMGFAGVTVFVIVLILVFAKKSENSNEDQGIACES